jgi:hypothetical protein
MFCRWPVIRPNDRDKRGMDFLVATQTPDGSWPMISRSTDGSPGVRNLTPITCRRLWAALGLAETVPKGSRTARTAVAPARVIGSFQNGIDQRDFLPNCIDGDAPDRHDSAALVSLICS